jgi:hypothetical protein
MLKKIHADKLNDSHVFVPENPDPLPAYFKNQTDPIPTVE